jgi:hypothetical protein
MFWFLVKLLGHVADSPLVAGGIETPPLELLVDGAEALVDASSVEPSPEGC